MGPPGERPPGLPAPAKPVAGGFAVARVLVLVPDLMLGSRVEATLAAEGHELVMGSETPNASLAEVDLVVADVVRCRTSWWIDQPTPSADSEECSAPSPKTGMSKSASSIQGSV